jgi:hypothetical protein
MTVRANTAWFSTNRMRIRRATMADRSRRLESVRQGGAAESSLVRGELELPR